MVFVEFKKEYLKIVLAYVFVIIYMIITNDLIITTIFILLLMTYHFVAILGIKGKLFQDKEDSVTLLLHKLDRTKKENEQVYKRFLSLSTTLGSGILMVDYEGKITFANKDVSDYFDTNFNNKDYQSFVALKPLYKFINQAYLLEKSLREQIVFENSFYDLISTPLFEDKLFRGCLIIVHDITQLKNAEQFQKQFTADVSHEIKTPLSAIKGFSEILERDKNISEKERNEFITMIYNQSIRMENIVNDLLIISKLDRLDYELELKSVDIKKIVTETTSVVKREIIDKGLELIIDIESAKLTLDKNKIEQVLINLLKNAINYTDDGKIEVKGYVKGNNYIIDVSDTGLGIKEENYDKIFKRFYRVDAARSRDTGGSGLGLSISKNVLIKHGGKILVESELNKGTTFKVILPIKK